MKEIKETRSNIVGTMLNGDEYRLFEAKVKKSGMKKSEYVRTLILKDDDESFSYRELVDKMFTEQGKELLTKLLK